MRAPNWCNKSITKVRWVTISRRESSSSEAALTRSQIRIKLWWRVSKASSMTSLNTRSTIKTSNQRYFLRSIWIRTRSWSSLSKTQSKAARPFSTLRKPMESSSTWTSLICTLRTSSSSSLKMCTDQRKRKRSLKTTWAGSRCSIDYPSCWDWTINLTMPISLTL